MKVTNLSNYQKHALFFSSHRVLITWLWLLFAALLALLPGDGYAQQRTLTGRITNEQGEPLESVSVVIKGTTNGTTTDAQGRFSLQSAPGDILVVSFVNYVPREIRTGSETDLVIQLQRTGKDLSEVIVVGYGTQRKKDVTGAVVSVSEKELRDVPVPNLQQALIGRAAGLEINQVGNQPGAGAQIRIRGTRSISGSNEPLFVVDGIPFEGTLNDINPDEIASVDILKDASATAIYGSRGANGVILVSTKKVAVVKPGFPITAIMELVLPLTNIR